MNSKEYHARKKHKEMLEVAHYELAISRYKLFLAKILRSEGISINFRIDGIMEPDDKTDIVILFFATETACYRIDIKLQEKKYKLAQIKRKDYEILSQVNKINKEWNLEYMGRRG